jgi:transcriptional regulator with XRE-family HTH domain
MTARKRQQLTEQLRQAIAGSGMSLYQLSQASGVHRSQLSRFIRGERDLGLEVADKVCEVLGLRFIQEGKVVAAGKPRGRPRKGK